MKQRKLLIIDDDPHYSGMLKLKLEHQFPELMIHHNLNKTILPGFDIYILDNNFDGDKCAAALAEEIRFSSPKCLVLILSATLELKLVKRLVNCHAAGVFDKTNKELDSMYTLIDSFLRIDKATIRPRAATFFDTITGINTLLNSWNKKLKYEEKQS